MTAMQILIEGLGIDTVIGVYDWERRIRQRVELDVCLNVDFSAAGRSDALVDTVDYKAVSDRLIAFVGDSQFELIEALAEAVADLLMTEYPVQGLRLTLRKPGAVPAARSVGVVIERG